MVEHAKKPALELNLSQTQTLVMTPQLQQAIHLLQLSNLELSDLIEKEMEQNPLLEREEKTAAPDTPLAPDQQIGSHLNRGAASTTTASYGDGTTPEIPVAEHPTLREHLYSQLNVDIADPVERLLGAQLIDRLDEGGYLREDIPALADRLGVAAAQLEAVLARLQQFDPPGVFARDLTECLRLQLLDQKALTPALEAVLAHLDLLGSYKKAELQKITGLSAEAISAAAARIKQLNPRPASDFNDEVAQAIVPDIFLRPQEGGGWLVELNNETLPRVLVNNSYYEQVASEARNKEEKQFITDKLQAANWLTRAMHQRAVTITRVASEIVRRQDAFFAYGVAYLRPLILKDVAEVLELHESTISRVTTNKYMSTPRGLFELKYFFSSGLSSRGASTSAETMVSATAVRHKISQMIAQETPDNILSDEYIAQALQKQGIDIARRTVAKYREAESIPSSAERRRMKRRN